MTDKQLIETLRNIKEYCAKCNKTTDNGFDIEFHICDGCKFKTINKSYRGNNCQLTMLIGNLTSQPRFWDMGKVERIINEIN